MLYLSIGLYLFFLSLLLNKERLFNLNCTLILLFLSLNYYNGFDWINYYYSYGEHSAAELLSIESMAAISSPGFSAVLAFSKLLGGYNYVFVISSIVFVFSARRFAAKTPNRNITIFLLYSFFGYFYYIERIKQGFAISFIILMIVELVNKKRFFAVVFFLLAVLFHPVAIVAIFLLAFPYHDELARPFVRAKGMLVITVATFFMYALMFTPLSGMMPGVIGYYLAAYSENIRNQFNISFYLSMGGISFACALIIFYLVARSEPPLRRKNYAFLTYFFSYVTGIFYNLIRVTTFFFPYIIYVLSKYSGEKKKNNLMRVAVLLIGLVQLMRPLATSYYFDSIMDYQIWGVSDRSHVQMQYIRCKALYKANAESEWADDTCSRKIF